MAEPVAHASSTSSLHLDSKADLRNTPRLNDAQLKGNRNVRQRNLGIRETLLSTRWATDYDSDMTASTNEPSKNRPIRPI